MLWLIAPGAERGEPTGFILEVTKAEQMGDPLLVSLDRAVHHGRRGAKARTMRVTHDIDPLVGRRLPVAVQQLSNTVHEDLGSTAGDTIEPGCDQSTDDFSYRKLRKPRNVNDFRRGQRVKLERRISFLYSPEEILVPG